MALEYVWVITLHTHFCMQCNVCCFLLLTTIQYETAFQLFISQGKHILKVVSQTTPPLLANTTAVHYELCLSIVLNLNDLYFMALYLGVKIKTLYLGFTRSQVTLPVMGMNHMLAERTWAFVRVVFILLPLSSEVFRTHKTFPKCMLCIDSASVHQLFLACRWPLGSFSFSASSLHDHPTQRDDLV